ncbi:MAG: hypothetical protein ACT4OO_16095 [Nitrospiraceae bacterium]
MSGKPKVKFLTVTWGERYIEEFARVSLPSFLASGNLPFLAQSTDLEVLIMTSEKSPRTFRREPAFEALEAICRVRFIFIDDLITTGNYGVTLTLAYARGIRDSGSQQTNTYFVFMNSDFVLADGSLRTLAAKIAEGHSCIMAPSLRACSETVLPLLIKSVDRGTKRLAIPAREMVQLAFDNLHPTVIGKAVTQDFVSCTTHNQIYWQVDPTTLIARYHLVFMLAIKPERPMPPVNSYCDYGFVPELVPSGRFIVLDDSDDFFMLELQAAHQEKQYLYCGRSSINEIARELSGWTTREHRRFAQFDLVFHSDDLPSNLEAARKQAADFMSELHRLTTNPPLSHVGHFYWVFGVQSWLTLKRADGDEMANPPPELEFPPGPPEMGSLIAASSNVRRAYLRMLGYLRRLAGAKPDVPIWHHSWLDSRLVLNWIASIRQRPHQRNLLVCSPYSWLARSLREKAHFDVIHVHSLLTEYEWSNGIDDQPVQKQYDNVLCHVYRINVRQTRRILERLTPLLDHDAVMGVYIEHEDSETDASNFSVELAQYVHEVLPAGWTGFRIRTNFAGGFLKRRLRLMERRLFRYLWPITWKKAFVLPFLALLWPIVAGLRAIHHWRLRNGYTSCPQFCSSALLCLSRPIAPLTADRSPQ